MSLKELYTSETTLAQKIVLASLNNEFVLEIRYSTPKMQKNPQIFLAKISKVPFRAVLALWCMYKYKNILNLKMNIFVY